MLRHQCSSILAPIVVGIMAAGLLIWVFSQSVRYLQCASGVLLLVLIGAVIVHGRCWKVNGPINIKDFILTSYAIFLGLGMISDCFRQDWQFNDAVILLAYGGLLCFLFGFMLHSSRIASRPSRKPAFLLTSNQLFKLALLFFTVGFSFLFLEWRLFGHLQSYSALTNAGFSIAVRPKPYIHTFTQLTGPGLLLALILLRRGTSPFRTCLLTCLAALTVAWYMFWGARINFAWLAMGILLVWREIPDRHGASKIGLKPLAFATLAIAAILVLSVIRTNWNFSKVRAEAPYGLGQQIQAGLDTYYQFRRTVEYFPRRADFLLGYSFYGIVANPIPRALWPEKPVGAGRLASILYDHNPDSTLGLSLPGELYANFGIAGLLIGMFLYGMIAAGIYRWYNRQRGNPGALVVYILLTEYMWFGIRGDLLDATSPILYQLAPAALCFALVTAMNLRVSESNLRGGPVVRPRAEASFHHASLLMNPRR